MASIISCVGYCGSSLINSLKYTGKYFDSPVEPPDLHIWNGLPTLNIFSCLHYLIDDALSTMNKEMRKRFEENNQTILLIRKNMLY